MLTPSAQDFLYSVTRAMEDPHGDRYPAARE